MSNLTVLAFESMDEAEQVHQALVRGKKQGLISIKDAAVVVKDQEGKVHVKNQVSSGTWTATGVGGLLGVLQARPGLPGRAGRCLRRSVGADLPRRPGAAGAASS